MPKKLDKAEKTDDDGIGYRTRQNTERNRQDSNKSDYDAMDIPGQVLEATGAGQFQVPEDRPATPIRKESKSGLQNTDHLNLALLIRQLSEDMSGRFDKQETKFEKQGEESKNLRKEMCEKLDSQRVEISDFRAEMGAYGITLQNLEKDVNKKFNNIESKFHNINDDIEGLRTETGTNIVEFKAELSQNISVMHSKCESRHRDNQDEITVIKGRVFQNENDLLILGNKIENISKSLNEEVREKVRQLDSKYEEVHKQNRDRESRLTQHIRQITDRVDEMGNQAPGKSRINPSPIRNEHTLASEVPEFNRLSPIRPLEGEQARLYDSVHCSRSRANFRDAGYALKLIRDPDRPIFENSEKHIPNEFVDALYERYLSCEGYIDLKTFFTSHLAADGLVWYDSNRPSIKSWEDFRKLFLRKYYYDVYDGIVMREIAGGSYFDNSSVDPKAYLSKLVLRARACVNPQSENFLCLNIGPHFGPAVADSIAINNITTIDGFMTLLERMGKDLIVGRRPQNFRRQPEPKQLNKNRNFSKPFGNRPQAYQPSHPNYQSRPNYGYFANQRPGDGPQQNYHNRPSYNPQYSSNTQSPRRNDPYNRSAPSKNHGSQPPPRRENYPQSPFKNGPQANRNAAVQSLQQYPPEDQGEYDSQVTDLRDFRAETSRNSITVSDNVESNFNYVDDNIEGLHSETKSNTMVPNLTNVTLHTLKNPETESDSVELSPNILCESQDRECREITPKKREIMRQTTNKKRTQRIQIHKHAKIKPQKSKTLPTDKIHNTKFNYTNDLKHFIQFSRGNIIGAITTDSHTLTEKDTQAVSASRYSNWKYRRKRL